MVLVSCSDKKTAANATENETTQPEKPKDPNAAILEKADRYWNDLARYFGGLEPLEGSKLNGLEERPEAVEFRQFYDKAWEMRKTKLIDRLEPWAEQELAAEHKSTRNVFYPFSGPDFFTVHTLYPKANTYVMFGLEKEGLLPDTAWLNALKTNRLADDFLNMKKSLDDILYLTFFKTKDMGGDFIRSQFTGSLPVLLGFIARKKQEVLLVEPVTVSPQGKLLVNQNPPQKLSDMQPRDTVVTGMRVWFRAKAGAPIQQVMYFGTDVVDEEIKDTPHFVTYLESLKPASGYVKSASYLMHYGSFSTVRNTLFKVVETWMQDDTGVAFDLIPKDEWDIWYYGKYDRPIQLFRNRFQQSLWNKYNKENLAQDMPFGMGYTSREYNSNVIICRRKGTHDVPLPKPKAEGEPAAEK